MNLLGRCVERVDAAGLAGLWDRTGGRTYFLRLILWTLFDTHAGQVGRDSSSKVRLSSLTDKDVAGRMRWTSHLRYVNDLIEADPECWSDLERLVAGTRLVPATHPHLLELSGLAVRSNGRLQFPGTLIKAFVKNHYTKRRFADHYARIGDWPRAFSHYKELAGNSLVRPGAVDDIADARVIVRSVGASLYAEATRGPDAVLNRFREACLHVLGFGEVSLWRYIQREDHMPEQPPWQPVTKNDFSSPSLEEATYLAVLPDGLRAMGKTRLDRGPRRGTPLRRDGLLADCAPRRA